MATPLLTQTIDEETREEAQELNQQVRDRRIDGVYLHLEDGTEMKLSNRLESMIAFVIKGVTQGDLKVTSLPEELTTTSAAQILGVSRPTLMKMVLDETLPSFRVGSHYRFFLEDVLKLKEERRERRLEGFRKLRALDIAEGISD